MKRYLIVAVGLVVVSAILVLVFWDRSAARVEEHLQAAQGELQLKRAVTTSETALANLERADLVIALTAADIDRLQPLLLAGLNTSSAAKEHGLSFDAVDIKLGDQSLSLSATFVYPHQDIQVRATLHASAAVGATSSGLHWNLYFDGLEVNGVDSPSRLDDLAAKALAAHLLELKPVLNMVLDEAVNDSPSTAMLLPLGQNGILNDQLADLSSDEVTFDDRPLSASLVAESTGVIIDKRGILVVSDVQVVATPTAEHTATNFPADAALVLQPAEAIRDRIAGYRAALLARIRERHADALDPLLERTGTGAAVSKETISRIFNAQFDKEGLAATIAVNKPSSSSSDITFQISARDCSAYFDACHYRDTCAGNRCEQKVNRTVSGTCEVQCWLSGGGIVEIFRRGTCKEACDKVVEDIVPIDSIHCGAFRETDKLYGGLLCKAASNVDKAVCDIDAAGHKLACSTVQEVRRFFEKNPVATVSTTITPDATLRASLTAAHWSPDLSTFDATLAAEGNGIIRAGIRYDRHNYADAAILGPGVSLGLGCAVDWAETVKVDSHVTLGPSPVRFTMTPSVVEGDVLRLQFNQEGTVMAHADFRPGPLVALFAGKPHITLNCPLAAISAVVFGSAEAVFSQEDARKVFPLLTGENYPIELKSQQFKVDIKPVTVCGPGDENCEMPMMVLVPIADRTVVRFAANPDPD